MLERYGDEADIESAIRAEELADAGDWTGEAIWRWIVECDRAAREHNTSRTTALTGTMMPCWSPVHGVASGVEEPDRVVVRGSTGWRSKALRGEKENPNAA